MPQRHVIKMSLSWRICNGSRELIEGAADFILSCAEQSIARHQRFQIVLAGGQTPAPVYRRLCQAKTDWSAWHVYFSDERCVAADDPGRNSHMARESLFSHVPVPAIQIHVIETSGGIEQSVTRYGDLVRRVTPFDLVLLGVGEDGHTASLFPGEAFDLDAWCVAVHGAPKPPTERISLGLRALRATEQVLVMASGYGKQKAVDDWQRGLSTPINAVTAGLRGLVLLDRTVVTSLPNDAGQAKGGERSGEDA